MHILVITTILPAGQANGGEVWTQAVIDGLRRNGADVQVIGFDRSTASRGQGEIGLGIHPIETRQAPLRALWWGLRALVGRPYTVEKWYSRHYVRRIAALIRERRWDLVIIDHAQMGWAARVIGETPFIHLSHQEESAVFAALAQAVYGIPRWLYAREARMMARVEGALVRAALETWCLSATDEAALTRHGAGKVRVLPPLARPGCEGPPAAEAPCSDVVLLGNWRWEPNAMALRWFLEQVCPRLPPGWRIDVGGAVDTRRQPAPPGVRFFGPVADVSAFFRRGRCVAVPSLAVAGANLKLLDAIASGRPVVASRQAIALIGAVPADVWEADDAIEFAAALLMPRPPKLADRRRWLAGRQVALDTGIAAALASLSTSQRPADHAA
ncbi:glycosyltransferase [Sphingomonas flavalba]|uniref:glycosyltransferase n=1 Tax=Sphingomonas flavalba TaxID=2559804 RepID=UPI00109DEA8A|nr:glycosyltransferase [Sphingomonas flavalba]